MVFFLIVRLFGSFANFLFLQLAVFSCSANSFICSWDTMYVALMGQPEILPFSDEENGQES